VVRQDSQKNSICSLIPSLLILTQHLRSWSLNLLTDHTVKEMLTFTNLCLLKNVHVWRNLLEKCSLHLDLHIFASKVFLAWRSTRVNIDALWQTLTCRLWWESQKAISLLISKKL
jgi:hypothetical protein